jgi:hypothetical protein
MDFYDSLREASISYMEGRSKAYQFKLPAEWVRDLRIGSRLKLSIAGVGERVCTIYGLLSPTAVAGFIEGSLPILAESEWSKWEPVEILK